MSDRSAQLRIMHVLPSLGLGGAEVMAAHLMTGLAARHSVAAVELGPSRNSEVERRLLREHVQVYHLGKRGGVDLRMFGALRRTLQEFRPDVVHTHLSVLRYLLPVLMRERVPLCVHTLHNDATQEADRIGKVVQRVAFAKTVVPVAISRDGAATFQRVYGRSCSAIIPNCIPVDDFQRPAKTGPQWRRDAGFNPTDTLFACVGRLDEQKDPLALISAFAAVRHPDTHLLLIGIGALMPRVRALIAAQDLVGRVHLLGSRSDVGDLLAASDAFVLASRWEGSPLAVMEAMASGLPIISTAVGGVPELVDHEQNGILVPPGKTADLGLAMQSLASDTAKRRSMGGAARAKAVREFAVQSMTHRYGVLYQSLLSKAPETQLKPWIVREALGARAAENEGR